MDSACFATTPDRGKMACAVFLNDPRADESSDTSVPQCLGVMESTCNGSECNMILSCTDRLRRMLNLSRPVQLTIVSKVGRPIRWEGLSLSVQTSVD